jgi:hypothetical protein
MPPHCGHGDILAPQQFDGRLRAHSCACAPACPTGAMVGRSASCMEGQLAAAGASARRILHAANAAPVRACAASATSSSRSRRTRSAWAPCAEAMAICRGPLPAPMKRIAQLDLQPPCGCLAKTSCGAMLWAPEGATGTIAPSRGCGRIAVRRSARMRSRSTCSAVSASDGRMGKERVCLSLMKGERET